jgi:hypothetical protein
MVVKSPDSAKSPLSPDRWSAARRFASVTVLAMALGIHPHASAQDAKPMAWWSFDGDDEKSAVETISGGKAGITGFTERVEGVRGTALKFDGFTSRVTHDAGLFTTMANGFTVEAWIAPQTYSWNWTGIVDQETNHQEGFSFGINHIGQVGLALALDGKWQTVVSAQSIPLLKWSHAAVTYDPAGTVSVFINGQLAGSRNMSGNPSTARQELWIGTSHTKQWPALTEREVSKTPTPMIFDGLIDEVKLHTQALAPHAVEAAFKSATPENPEPLKYRKMPSGPDQPVPFGAYYTRLKYCEEWDRLWRTSDHPDVVVRFDGSPTKIVFWRGTGYCPAWVTENDRWVSDQGPEIFKGRCYEHMSDKQCRFSHVRVIENTPARILVHWRTALPDVKYETTDIDPQTGWGPWGDDYYYIYPDGVCVRHQRAWSTMIHEFQQSEVLCQPGTKPQDNLETHAITVMDLDGNMNTYSWDVPYGRLLPAEREINGPIQITNLKSRNRHYVIGETGSVWKPFKFGALKGYTNIPNWNHWPVAQLPNDGRIAPAPDRPSSACLGTLYPVRHQGEGVRQYVRNLYGLTDRDPSHLAVLGRSWNQPAKLTLQGGGFTSEGHDKNQRAYVLNRLPSATPPALMFELAGSNHSPVLNPAFVIANWGDADAMLTLDGKMIPRGGNFRFGHRQTLEGTDLIVWIETLSRTSVTFRLEPLR